MDFELVKMLQQRSKRRALCHLGKGVDIIREALAAKTDLAVDIIVVSYFLQSRHLFYLIG